MLLQHLYQASPELLRSSVLYSSVTAEYGLQRPLFDNELQSAARHLRALQSTLSETNPKCDTLALSIPRGVAYGQPTSHKR